jgi:deoxyinosine 3'endonuclease (endonuclease V)
LYIKKVILEDRLPLKIRTVGGVDVSYIGNLGIGAVSVLDYESLECLESSSRNLRSKDAAYSHFAVVSRNLSCFGSNQKVET